MAWLDLEHDLLEEFAELQHAGRIGAYRVERLPVRHRDDDRNPAERLTRRLMAWYPRQLEKKKAETKARRAELEPRSCPKCGGLVPILERRTDVKYCSKRCSDNARSARARARRRAAA